MAPLQGPLREKAQGKKIKELCQLRHERPWLFPLLSSGETLHGQPTIVDLISFIVIKMTDVFVLIAHIVLKKQNRAQNIDLHNSNCKC